MTRLNRYFAIFFAVLAATVFTVGCTATRTQESTGQYLDDTATTARVKAAILGDADLKASEINVETFKGRVQLSGFVRSRSDIDRAVNLVRGLRGVQTVQNDMRVK